MSNLTQAVAMLGPAAVMTGAASLLLPRGAIQTAQRGLTLRVNAILGPLLLGITLAILMLLPGPFNPNPLLEICYLLGGFLALFMTALSAAVLTGAVLYRRRTKRAKTPKPPTR